MIHDASTVRRARVVVGFDGFIDEMIQVVDERQGLDQWRPMGGIAAFGAWATAAAGRNSLREIVVNRQDPGGCAINLADGAAALGAQVDLFATIGAPAHPAFAAVTRRCASAHPVGEVHGRTLALEFPDGKLMFCAVSQLATIDADLARRVLTEGAYPAACAQAGVIALTNWTLYPHMTAIWDLLIGRVYGRLGRRVPFLVDLVDPQGRTEADRLAMLVMLRRLETCGPVTLSLKLNEATGLCRLLGLSPGEIPALAATLRPALGLSEILVHNARLSAVATADGVTTRVPPWCASPVKLTGAGDRCNAGYAVGLALGLPVADRLELGNATASHFVATGSSGGVNDLRTAG